MIIIAIIGSIDIIAIKTYCILDDGTWFALHKRHQHKTMPGQGSLLETSTERLETRLLNWILKRHACFYPFQTIEPHTESIAFGHIAFLQCIVSWPALDQSSKN